MGRKRFFALPRQKEEQVQRLWGKCVLGALEEHCVSGTGCGNWVGEGEIKNKATGLPWWRSG